MGRYRAHDLLLVPSLLSLVRVPLGAFFPFVAHRPIVALVVLAVAGLTDVADGWYARRTGQVTAMGAAIDAISDKLFVAAVVATLIADGDLPLLAIAALAAREIGELPLVLWVAGSHRARRARADHASANLPGKLATVLQFLAIAASLFHSRWMVPLLWITAAMGAIAAISYWRRELRIRSRAAALAPR